MGRPFGLGIAICSLFWAGIAQSEDDAVTAFATLPAATAPATQPATQSAPTLVCTLVPTDTDPAHIFYPKDKAVFPVALSNSGEAPLPAPGSIIFGRWEGPAFVVVQSHLLTPALIPPGGRLRVDVPVEFAQTGRYELRIGSQVVATGMPIHCILPPRTEALKGQPSPWLGAMPDELMGSSAATVTDYIQHTAIQTLVWDYPWHAPNRPLITQEAVDQLVAGVKAGSGQLILRIGIRTQAHADPRDVADFNEFMTALAKRAKGVLTAVVVAPLEADQAQASYTSYYLAAYAAAKRADPNTRLLATGMALRDALYLTGQPAAAGLSWGKYQDGIGSRPMAGELATALKLAAGRKHDVWVLPWAAWDGPVPAVALPAVAALAAGATRVPLTGFDHGTKAHLFTGATYVGRVHDDQPYYLAAYQGQGYGVVALAGLGAGTLTDLKWPEAAARMNTGTAKPATLSVPDPDGSMRVVDNQGRPVECRKGDTLVIPLGREMVYLLGIATAEDMLALLRPQSAVGLPAELSQIAPKELPQ